VATFGDRVKELRNEKGLTQEQLGDMVGLKQSSIGMIEINRREVSNKILVRLADIFGVTTDYLLGRTDHRDAKIETYNIDSHDLEVEYDAKKNPQGLPIETIKEAKDLVDKLNKILADEEKLKKQDK
jgi:transcriptional regulator with XRE-family HTH domain